MARSLFLGAALFAAALPLGSALPLAAQDSRPQIYDESADARAEFAKACARARRDNKHVLVMFGANWCGWCHKLHAVFEQNRKVSRLLRYEYELLLVDIGKWNKHTDLVEELGADLKQGVPFLTVVGPDGHPIVNQETASLERGSEHDPEAVLAFLDRHKPEPLDAREVLAAAQKCAHADGRKLFIHLGAPWCGYCHMLEDWMARPEIAAILSKDFLDVKIDQDRMTYGKELAAELRKERRGGIPWIVITDAELGEEITSDGEQGNTGFPIQPHEIEHFMHMLGTTRSRITDEELTTLRESLEQNAAELLERRRKAAEERARKQQATDDGRDG